VRTFSYVWDNVAVSRPSVSATCRGVAVCCSVLQCVAACCSVLQRVAARFVAMSCSVSACYKGRWEHDILWSQHRIPGGDNPQNALLSVRQKNPIFFQKSPTLRKRALYAHTECESLDSRGYNDKCMSKERYLLSKEPYTQKKSPLCTHRVWVTRGYNDECTSKGRYLLSKELCTSAQEPYKCVNMFSPATHCNTLQHTATPPQHKSPICTHTIWDSRLQWMCC